LKLDRTVEISVNTSVQQKVKGQLKVKRSIDANFELQETQVHIVSAIVADVFLLMYTDVI